MIRCLHTADLHLGSTFPSFGAFGATREDDFQQTFRRLIDLAIQSEVDLFLVAGDLFDHPSPERKLVALVEGELQRLVQRGIRPILLPGTHDHLLGGDSVYKSDRFPGAIQLLGSDGPRRIEVNGGPVYLYSSTWTGGQSGGLQEIMRRQEAEGIHLGLLHGSLEGCPDWDYRSKDQPFTLPALKQWGLDYVALGHYHRFQKLEDPSRLWACYPGSPEGKRFGENGSRYGLVVEVDSGEAKVNAVPVQTRELLEPQLELDAGMSEQQVAAAVAATGAPGKIVRLHLRGVVDHALDRDYLDAYAGAQFDWLEIVDHTRWLQSEFISAVAAEETVRGACVRRFQSLLDAAEDDPQKIEIEQAFREVMVRFQGGGQV